MLNARFLTSVGERKKKINRSVLNVKLTESIDLVSDAVIDNRYAADSKAAKRAAFFTEWMTLNADVQVNNMVKLRRPKWVRCELQYVV